MKLVAFLLSLCLICNQSAYAGYELTTEEKLKDFQQLVSSIQTGYGPYFYKKQNGIMNPDEHIQSYEEKVKQV